MRPPWLALLVALLAAQASACPAPPPRPWRDDLVVVGMVTRVGRRIVRAYGADYEEVRSLVVVERVLWCDADRPPSAGIFLHSTSRHDLHMAPPAHGRVGARCVFVLGRTRSPDAYLFLQATAPEGPGLRWGLANTRIVGGRLADSGDVSIELRCENPHDVPVTFGGPGELATLAVGTTRTSIDLGAPLVVPPGRYRTQTLRLRSDALADTPEAEATLEARSLLLEPTSWDLELRRAPTPSLAYLPCDGPSWPLPAQERLAPAWLDPDDPALAPPSTADARGTARGARPRPLHGRPVDLPSP